MSASFSPDGQRILTAGKDGTLRIWSAKDARTLQIFDVGPVADASFNRRGDAILCLEHSDVGRCACP